ncbi:hypothetical protein [Streptomyces cyaneofuscatus]|nr:hypothetical protein [Streptomyces cyaneofuscatus]
MTTLIVTVALALVGYLATYLNGVRAQRVGVARRLPAVMCLEDL